MGTCFSHQKEKCLSITNVGNLNSLSPVAHERLSAPNLLEFNSHGDTSLIRRLMGRSQAVIISSTQARAPFNEIPNSVIAELRLEKLRLEYTGSEFNYERFHMIIPILLVVSCNTTLHEVILDAVLAVPLMCYRVSLQNVKRLYMLIDYSKFEQVEPRILTFVKNFDFTHIFPSLDKVTIDRKYHFPDLSSRHMNLIIEQANEVLKEPQPYRACNIKQLNLKDALSNASAAFFAEMFPNVKRLQLTPAQEEEVPFGSIWKYWEDLEELQVDGINTANLNTTVVCGIFPAGVKGLRLPETGHQRIHIVPVTPAIACLRNPSAFTLVFCQSQDYCTLVFSKKTGVIAFPRCPSLVTNFKTTLDDVCESLQQIKTYASEFSPHDYSDDDCAFDNYDDCDFDDYDDS